MRAWILRCLLPLALLAGCASAPPDAVPMRFVLVRHAEKATDDPRDPNLTDAGRARAETLARRLQSARLVAVYASDTRRAQQTAAPSARAHDLPITTYDAAQPAPAFAAALRRSHASGTVLVVGHSNTIPAIASALCGCAIGPTADTEFGRRITIDVLPDGRATVDDRREP
ncbi:phosphoglycerate mutase family protein [Lysobacter xanthus]